MIGRAPTAVLLGTLAAAGTAAQTRSPGPAIALVRDGRPAVVAHWSGAQWTEPVAGLRCPAALPSAWQRLGELWIAPGLKAEAPQPIGRGDRAWPAVESAVGRVFAAREREQRLSEANISLVPMTLDAVFRAGDPASGSYYFEASKRIEDALPPPPAPAGEDVDPRGVLRIAVTGWLRADGARMQAAATKGELHWEQVDGRGQAALRPAYVPLAVLSTGPLPVWVMRAPAGPRSHLALYEVGPSHARVLVSAGDQPC